MNHVEASHNQKYGVGIEAHGAILNNVVANYNGEEGVLVSDGASSRTVLQFVKTNGNGEYRMWY